MGAFSYLLSPWCDINRKRSGHGDALPALDGVRGLAVLMVLGSHTGILGLSGQGSLGVFLFFCLSGFVLMLPFADNPERIIDLREVVSFVSSRVLRIIPAYLVALAVLYAFLPKTDWAWLRLHLIFAAAWGHLWSVAEEARFYLLFPFVVLALVPLRSRAMRFIAVMFMVAVAWATQDMHAIPLVGSTYVPFYFYIFLAGVAAALVYRALALPEWFLRGAPVAILVLMFVTSDAVTAVIWRRLWPAFPQDLSFAGWSWPGVWAALFAMLLLSVVQAPTTPVARVLASRPLRLIGLVSYGLYLFHVPVMILLEHWHIEGLTLFAATLAGGYAVAAVSYLLVEKPALLLKSVIRRLATSSTPASGAVRYEQST